MAGQVGGPGRRLPADKAETVLGCLAAGMNPSRAARAAGISKSLAYVLDREVSGGNEAATAIIRSVVTEEMLHLTLAANLLNAVGGRPVLDDPKVLPRYPGPLPGTADDGLTVGLAPFSVGLVRDTFMRIEQPERSLDFGAPAGADAAADAPLTIGQFYRRIRTTLVALGEDAFTGRRHHQVTADWFPGIIAVTGVASACLAIDTIIDQGEGTLASPLEIVGTDVAHYYRFAEIVHGRRLVRNPDAGPGTPPDRRYSVQLHLHGPAQDPAAAFNGTPRELKAAIGLMASLQQQATDMMAGKATSGAPVGPSFEWQPTG